MGKRLIRRVLLIVLCGIVNVLMFRYLEPVRSIDVVFSGAVENAGSNDIQIFWGGTEEFTEEHSRIFKEGDKQGGVNLLCPIPSDTKYLRIDFGTKAARITLRDLGIKVGNTVIPVDITGQQIRIRNQSAETYAGQGTLEIRTEDGDPFLVFDVEEWGMEQLCRQETNRLNKRYRIIACVYTDLMVLLLWGFRIKIIRVIRMFTSRGSLIWDLAVNDFKTKFAGAAFGTVWAFIQPIVTILVYWFVFQVGFRSGTSGNTQVPYALWLSTGLIPWFFFSDAWNSATNSLMEYSYLVKKVVFDVSIIPCVKIFSALFVHCFFVILLMVMYLINGVAPGLCWIQAAYYSFAMFVLVLAVTYLTSALVLFFRDMSQIIAVFLQVGVWITPIMWEIDVIPERWQWVFKINPMYYIVNGYRQALIYHEWAWDNVLLNVYFWTVTMVLLFLGYRIFEKLKPHFADVL